MHPPVGLDGCTHRTPIHVRTRRFTDASRLSSSLMWRDAALTARARTYLIHRGFVAWDVVRFDEYAACGLVITFDVVRADYWGSDLIVSASPRRVIMYREARELVITTGSVRACREGSGFAFLADELLPPVAPRTKARRVTRAERAEDMEFIADMDLYA